MDKINPAYIIIIIIRLKKWLKCLQVSEMGV